MTSAVDLIDAHDMETVLGILSPKSLSNELKQRIDAADKDNAGKIDYDEFRSWVSKTDAHLIFKLFDVDGDGLIDEAEMETIFRALDESWTSEKVKQVLQDARLNGDGKIDYEEFLAWAFKQVQDQKLYSEQSAFESGGQLMQAGYTSGEIDLMQWGSNGTLVDAEEPRTPIRASSRQLSFSNTLADVTNLAERLSTLDPSLTPDKAQQLVDNAHRSLSFFPAK